MLEERQAGAASVAAGSVLQSSLGSAAQGRKLPFGNYFRDGQAFDSPQQPSSS